MAVYGFRKTQWQMQHNQRSIENNSILLTKHQQAEQIYKIGQNSFRL